MERFQTRVSLLLSSVCAFGKIAVLTKVQLEASVGAIEVLLSIYLY